MLNMFNRYFGRSSSWNKVRQEHLKNQPYCQACGKKNDLQVHHIEPYHKNPDRELDPDNLITLCGKNCHLVFGHLLDYKSWNENVKEDCEIYLNKIQNRPYNENFSSKPFSWYDFFADLFFWNNRSSY